MSSRILIPFDNNPSSISKKTASYTVPSGKYAMVKTSSAFFFIDAVQIYHSNTISTASSISGGIPVDLDKSMQYSSSVHVFSTSLTKTGTNISTLTGSFGGGTVNAYGDALYSVTRTTAGTTTVAQAIELNATILWSNTTLVSSTTGSSQGSWSISYYFTPNLGVTDFWVPSGTVLNGSNYIVMEYNVIS